jgi:hypothetical protein
LLSAPETWLEDNRQVQAMIVHGTKMGHHAVGAGLMPHQRSQIIEWAESALPDGLVRVPDLKRSNRGLAKVSNAPLSRFKGTAEEQDQAKETERARAATARREALALSQGNRQVDLRLLWQTTETRDAAINAVVDLLGLPVDVATRHPGGVVLSHDGIEASRREDPLLLVWGTPELTVRLRCLKLTGDCAGNLGVKNGRINPQGLPLAEAIQQRRARIADFLNSDQEALRAGGIEWARPSLAMIEIDRRKDFASVADDPKYALRLGSADAGVLTQFALVPKRTKQGAAKVKDLAFRVTEAWTDGLRQLGLRVWPQHTALGMVPDGLQFLGLWMVTRRRDSRTRETGHLPVAVLSTPVAEHPGMVRVMGWDKSADDERGAWISYPEFLLRLTKLAVVPEDIDPDAIWDGVTDEEPQTNAQGKARQGFREWVSIQEAKRQDTFHLLQNVLRSPEVRDTPTVLLTAAQNSRSYWPAIQDQAVVADRIRTGNAPMARLPRSLRLVRVRTNAERETPQWWATTREGVPNGLAAGLWVEPAQAPRDTATMAPDVRGPLSAERVFYSTAEKAVTAKDSAVSADRLTFRPILAGKRKGDLTIDTGKMAHNPSLLEIAVLGCHCDPPSLASGVDASSHRDDPETLAFVVHQLRQAPDYQDALLLPLPLHLAKQTEEYVLPTRADDQNEDDEAAEVVMVGEDHEQAELLLPT